MCKDDCRVSSFGLRHKQFAVQNDVAITNLNCFSCVRSNAISDPAVEPVSIPANRVHLTAIIAKEGHAYCHRLG